MYTKAFLWGLKNENHLILKENRKDEGKEDAKEKKNTTTRQEYQHTQQGVER